MKHSFLFSLLFFISCENKNCEDLNSNFKSYNEAIEIVQNTSFAIEEKVDTDSSWIDSIEYYSCDEVSGYLIVNTKKDKSYIHKNVPIQVWNEFKKATSFGKFYNRNIKGVYQM
jgi:hypothetical protein